VKRFYKHAGVQQDGGAWAVALDGRPVRTPGGGTLALPTSAAADLLAAEWEGQGDEVDPHAMPLTRLVNVALDRTPQTREGVADEIARYGQTDAICHLADAPEGLQARQDAAWTPLRDWAHGELGVELKAVCGVLAADQPEASLARIRTLALELDDVRLTALAHATALLGSAILAFALLRGRLDAVAANAAATLEAAWQAEQWGEDAEAANRAAQVLAEIIAVENLLKAMA